MDNKKIVAPIMAIAICAITMVGLGFALETNVTSSNNEIEIFQIDLNETNTFGNGVTNTPVNTFLITTISSTKGTNGALSYNYDGKTYLKIFTNNNNYEEATLSVSSSYSGTTNGQTIDANNVISKVTLKITNVTTGSDTQSAILEYSESTASVELDQQLSVGVVYLISVESIESTGIIDSNNNLNFSFTFKAEDPTAAT